MNLNTNTQNTILKTTSPSSKPPKPKRKYKKKRLIIKAFKKQPRLSDTYESDTLQKLITAVDDIHHKRPNRHSFEELYKLCQQLCTLKKGRQIYHRLFTICDSHISQLIKNINNLNEKNSNAFLIPIKKIWDNHRQDMHAIRQIFLMLDKTYIRQQKLEHNIKSIWMMGIYLLKKHVNNYTICDKMENDEENENYTDFQKPMNLENMIISHVLKVIENERNGEEIDKHLLHSVILMFVHLDIFKKKFEKRLIFETNVYYKKEAEKVKQMSIAKYLLFVIHCIGDEEKRTQEYLLQDMNTQRFLVNVIEEQMVKMYYDYILNKGFVSLMDEQEVRLGDLKNLYVLYERVGELEGLQTHLMEYIKVLCCFHLWFLYFRVMKSTLFGKLCFCSCLFSFLGFYFIFLHMLYTVSCYAFVCVFFMCLCAFVSKRSLLFVVIKIRKKLYNKHLCLDLQLFVCLCVNKMRGVDMVQNKSRDKDMIQRLLHFKRKLDNTIANAFSRNHEFRHVVRRAWEYFLNERQNKPAELMAKFIDYQLQTGARGTSEQELEDILDAVMDIFRFVHGKDVFQAFYKKDLAKRLLLNTSASEDAEKNMVIRIRKECGQTYASNLEKMFKDIDIAQDLNEKFKLHWMEIISDNFSLSKNKKLTKNKKSTKNKKLPKNKNNSSFSKNLSKNILSKITSKALKKSTFVREKVEQKSVMSLTAGMNVEMNIQILTSGCWPSYDIEPIILPTAVQQKLDEYTRFYVGINDGRKINWTADLSHCILIANFPKGKKELVLSAFQATVLMLFNIENRIIFDEFFVRTKIKKNSLKNTLLSLVMGGILLKNTEEIKSNTMFKLNKGYENRLRRVKVNQIQIIETVADQKSTTAKIFKDRQYQIDACVVRIMKSRKSLKHQQLMAECLKQLRFDADPKQIKKRIQKLIENEYLDRDENDNSLLHYKA